MNAFRSFLMAVGSLLMPLTAMADCNLNMSLAPITNQAHAIASSPEGGFKAIILCYKPALSSTAFDQASDDHKLRFLFDFINVLIPLVSKENLTDRGEYLKLGTEICDDFIEVFRDKRGKLFEPTASLEEISELRQVVYELGKLQNALSSQEELFDEYQSLRDASGLSCFDSRSAKQWYRGLRCEASPTCSPTDSLLSSLIGANPTYRDRWLKFYSFLVECAALPRIGPIVDLDHINKFFGTANTLRNESNASSR